MNHRKLYNFGIIIHPNPKGFKNVLVCIKRYTAKTLNVCQNSKKQGIIFRDSNSKFMQQCACELQQQTSQRIFTFQSYGGKQLCLWGSKTNEKSSCSAPKPHSSPKHGSPTVFPVPTHQCQKTHWGQSQCLQVQCSCHNDHFAHTPFLHRSKKVDHFFWEKAFKKEKKHWNVSLFF